MASPPRPHPPGSRRACRVSKMTVSRALRGQPGVSPDARRTHPRRGGQITATGRIPRVGSVMKFLRQQRASDYRENLAFVWTHPAPRHPALLVPWRDARPRPRRAASAIKLDEFFLRAPGMTSARLRAILQARGIRGILFAPDVERPFPRVSFRCARFRRRAARQFAAKSRPRSRAVRSFPTRAPRPAARAQGRLPSPRAACSRRPSTAARKAALRAGFLAHSPGTRRGTCPADLPRRSAKSHRHRRLAATSGGPMPSSLSKTNRDRCSARSGTCASRQNLGVVSLSKHNDARPDTRGRGAKRRRRLGHAAVDLARRPAAAQSLAASPSRKRSCSTPWSPGATLPSRRARAATSRPASRLSPKS